MSRARAADTYRGSRRNVCIRELKTMWTPQWYYRDHHNDPRWAIAAGLCAVGNQTAIYYSPAVKKAKRKIATHKSGIHAMLKRGDYGAAVRAFFSPRTKKSGRGD